MKWKDLSTKEITFAVIEEVEAPPHALLDACYRLMPVTHKWGQARKDRFARNYARIKHVCAKLDERNVRLDEDRLERVRQAMASRVGVQVIRYSSNEEKDAFAQQTDYEKLATGQYSEELDARNKLDVLYEIEYPDFLTL